MTDIHNEEERDEMAHIVWDPGYDPMPRKFGFVGRLLDKYFPVYSEQKRQPGFIAIYKSGKTKASRLRRYSVDNENKKINAPLVLSEEQIVPPPVVSDHWLAHAWLAIALVLSLVQIMAMLWLISMVFVTISRL